MNTLNKLIETTKELETFLYAAEISASSLKIEYLHDGEMSLLAETHGSQYNHDLTISFKYRNYESIIIYDRGRYENLDLGTFYNSLSDDFHTVEKANQINKLFSQMTEQLKVKIDELNNQKEAFLKVFEI